MAAFLASKSSELRQIRVLLVEDNYSDIELARAYLRRDDIEFEVEVTPRMGSALTMLKNEPFDVVVVDLSLPDSSAEETVGLLREITEVALVVWTGVDSESIRLDTLRHGVHEFLDKSGPAPLLVRGILSAIERKRHDLGMRQMVESNVDGVMVLDLEGTVMYANRAVAELFGREANALIGTNFGFPSFSGDLTRVDFFSDGMARTAEMRASQIVWTTGPATLVSIRDITERVKAESLEKRVEHAERLASIGQLAAGVAHEINNPAAFVVSNITLAKQRLATLRGRVASDNAAVREVIDDIESMVSECADGMHRITRTVRELSSFARTDDNEIELVDPNQLVKSACSLAANQLRHRARVVHELGELPRIPIDVGRMTQVLVNLLVNAGQATKSGTPAENEISVVSQFEDGEVTVAISDTGAGIPPELLTQVFVPFFTTKPRDRGTGLGLAIAAETVRKHGGRIDVDSVVGEGTTFRVVLPVENGLTPTRCAVPERATPALSKGRGRVLLVDDEAQLRRAMKRLLRVHHEVVEAGGGPEALKLLQEDRDFDLVLSDMMMPDMNGAEFYRRIRLLDEDLAERVIFLTGGAVGDEAKEFVALHSSRTREKPISVDEILALLEQVRR